MLRIIQTIIDAIFWRRAARRKQAVVEYYAKLDVHNSRERLCRGRKAKAADYG